MRSLLALTPLLLFLPAAAPAQTWYDTDRNYVPLPPEAATVHARLAEVDLLAAQNLVAETTGGRILEARLVDPVEPRLAGEDCGAFRDGSLTVAEGDAPHEERCAPCATWSQQPGPHCEIIAYTEESRLIARTDLPGKTILEQELVPRIPGWPVEGEWIELPSGAKYYDVEIGTGKEPRNSVTLVRTHFVGYLNDHTKFTSTYDMGRAMKGPLSGGIQGWKEALLSMKVGGKRKIIIPPEAGYGDAGKAPYIPPNATLFFDVHLVGLPRK